MSGKIRDYLDEAVRKLAMSGIVEPVVDASVLLCHILKYNRAYLYAHGGDSLEEAAKSRFEELLKLRCTGMPVQYLTGHQEFMSLDFEVNASVLIPRQDTEVLVEEMIEAGREYCRKRGNPPRILDIGTGSGCIAISLAHYLPGCMVTAADISSEALETARANSIRNGVSDRLEFINTDLFEGIKNRKFNIVVSNPPYIEHKDLPGLQREVGGFEPARALDGGVDGLDFYRRIVDGSPEILEPGGILAFEAGAGQAGEIVEMMKVNFTGVIVRKDLSGIDRVVSGTLREM